MLLEGKAAVVTGAGSGVGAASARRFAAEGARVLCADINPDSARETADSIESTGGTAFPVACDVADEADVVMMLRAAVDRFGRLDIVFNNVGVPTPRLGASLEEHTVSDFQRLFAVNVGGAFFGCKHAVIQFKRQQTSGVILNTGSVDGLVAWGGAVYGATKGALHQLTRAVAIEGAPFGIRANAICPAGMPYTNFMAAGGADMTAESIARIARHTAARHPLGRPITAQDCAEAAVFLVSDRAADITGALVPIDGGYVAG
ncbi:SDR family NAD(P)-dependent oxidoreductase [Nocardia jiangxiensis]|uniref:SDR family NAD(P)-dependent oxidoreductase n=1 Tax=Nocardia jiangxiensis TaxID=282685 RepID=UPI000594D919|nr:SDR family oxidoreductase [Nocardia jiangxiensis]